MKGTVIDVQVFTRDGIEKDQRAKDIERSRSSRRSARTSTTNTASSKLATYQRLRQALVGKKAASAPDMTKGGRHHRRVSRQAERGDDWFRIRMSEDALNEQLEKAEAQLKARREKLDARLRRQEAEARERRRSRAGRAEDREGVSRDQAAHSARRQDGWPTRQQRGDLGDHAGRRHAVRCARSSRSTSS